MNKMKFQLVPAVAIASLLLASCVPARRYQESQTAKQNVESENASLKKQNEQLTAQQNELQSKLDVLKKSNTELERDTSKLGDRKSVV